MPQAFWAGMISFGLVNVPVRLYPATRKKDVRFHELDQLTGQRVRHQRVALQGPPPVPSPQGERNIPGLVSETPHPHPPQWGRVIFSGPQGGGEPKMEPPPLPALADVPASDVVKGYEVAPDRYVTISRQELEALAPERTRTIDIEQFVEASAVDPIYYETSYYVVPYGDHVRSFGLLLEAMRQTGKQAISWIVLRRKRHLATLRPYRGLMLLTTMLHSDEVLSPSGLEPSAPSDLTKKEREMAALLVNTLTGPFEPERYRDEYRQRLLELIEGRAASSQRVVTPSPTGARVEDLMAALQASVKQVRKAAKLEVKPGGRRRRKSA